MGKVYRETFVFSLKYCTYCNRLKQDRIIMESKLLLYENHLHFMKIIFSLEYNKLTIYRLQSARLTDGSSHQYIFTRDSMFNLTAVVASYTMKHADSLAHLVTESGKLVIKRQTWYLAYPLRVTLCSVREQHYVFIFKVPSHCLNIPFIFLASRIKTKQ